MQAWLTVSVPGAATNRLFQKGRKKTKKVS